MSSVFHYTDTVGLLGILENETLFATDYRYLNDSSEGEVVHELLLPIFEAEIAKITPKLIEKKWLKKEFYDEHGVSGHRLQAEVLYKSINRATNSVSPFFVLSFCRHKEGGSAYKHGLLSQWRGYAHGGGFAIEFDEDALDELMQAEQNQFCYALFKSSDVKYEKFEDGFDPKLFEGVAGEMIRRLFEDEIDVSEVTGRRDVDEAVLELAKLAPFLKHPGFKEELEYRMVGVCVRRSKIPESEPRPAKSFQFRQKNGLVVPYIELFENGPSLPIKSIIVGPSRNQEMQAEAVAMVAEKEGFSIDIRLSDIPFRW